MKKGAAGVSSVAAWCLVAVLVLVAEVHVTAAANCNPSELSMCLGSITGSQQPSPQCCTKLKEQEPCFCGYLKNPTIKPYLDSPNAKKVAATCRVAVPKCYVGDHKEAGRP